MVSRSTKNRIAPVRKSIFIRQTLFVSGLLKNLGIKKYHPEIKVNTVRGSKFNTNTHKEVFVMVQAKTVPAINGLL